LPSGPKFVHPTTDVPVAVKRPVAHNGVSKVKLKGSWAQPVKWDGQVKEKRLTGADVGNSLYNRKKRMFKGHKWERTTQAREKKKKMLMRDMEKRVKRFKGYYKRRKPSPLKPARSTKAAKLPF